MEAFKSLNYVVGNWEYRDKYSFYAFCPFIPSYLQPILTFKGFHLDVESL